MGPEDAGLTTKESFKRLHDDILVALNDYEGQQDRNGRLGYQRVLHEAFHHTSYQSVCRWTSALALSVASVALLVGYAAESTYRYEYLPAQAVFIMAVVLVSVSLSWWEARLRYNELPFQVRRMLALIHDYQNSIHWLPEHYPGLFNPTSPCITLQWTRRDNALVNLPWSLLVKGDVIFLKPGQTVPGTCCPYQTNSSDAASEPLCELYRGDFFSPRQHPESRNSGCGEPFTTPRQRTPLKETAYVLQETPYVTNLKLVLFEGLSRPPSLFNRLRFVLLTQTMEWVVLPVSLMDPTSDPFEESELESLPMVGVPVRWGELRRHLWHVAVGSEASLVRTASLLHVMASVTNLCCVDKKGILSWPNPTAEKIFFLKNRANNEVFARNGIFSSVPSLYGDDEVFLECKDKIHNGHESESVLMSLSHDHQTAFGLQFDDPSWRRYLLSLKPLGLNILVNTCNPATHERYSQFCSHISSQAIYNENLVPVSHRRCLCELSKQIGFSEHAQLPFVLEHQLSTFRHVTNHATSKDRLARSLMTTKLKFPFPHMMSVMMRDRGTRKLELFSQGTADVILETCTDYWDGYDICPLTEKDRKKILDFYHRTSLSSYCTAFSYRPTACTVKSDLSQFYMELPIDPSHLYANIQTPTPFISSEVLNGDLEGPEKPVIETLEDCFRVQCKQIFIAMVTMQYQAKTDMVKMIEQLDMACIRFVHFSKENELRSRVFSEKMGLESGWNCHISLMSNRSRSESGNSSKTGLTASAKASGVVLHRQSLIDLNGAEAGRSRCRNSLEESRTLSHSAPSAINLEVSTVKFDDEVSVCSQSTVSPMCCAHEPDEQCNIECENTAMLNTADDIPARSRSPSRVTEMSEHSSSWKFDMSNRAQLPRGIENIRPHLQFVDNVPLLVSLFTDCVTPTTRSMLAVMQDYGEVTLVLGSTANAENTSLFLQADASLGLEPLYPQACMREPVMTRPPHLGGRLSVTPTEVARLMNALPCSLAFHREDKVSLIHLVMESRHFMQHVVNCLQFWACCCCSVMLLQLLAALAALPPLLSAGDVVWITGVIVPVLSTSLVAAPVNPMVMNQATGKSIVVVNRQIVRYVFVFYVSKFVPSVIVAALCAGVSLAHVCRLVASETNGTCNYVYLQAAMGEELRNTSMAWGGWGDQHEGVLVTIQNGVTFLLVLYFAVISASFVHRMYSLWHKNPITNRVWLITVSIILLVQLIYTSASMSAWSDESKVLPLSVIPLWVWGVGLVVWPVLLVPINEVVKRREIRVNVRYQKRARLEFGTKLGMNSPF